MAFFGRSLSLQRTEYNFTERLRAVLSGARDAAAELGHEYVGTEHLLIALLRDDGGVTEAVLDMLGADRRVIDAKIRDTVRTGSAPPAGRDLPYTSRAKHTLELAMTEARELGHSYVSAEHLLLGLLVEKKGIAAQVLVDSGVYVDAVRAATVRLLGGELPPEGRPAPTERPAVAPMPADHTSTPTAAEQAAEELAWTRLRNALDVTALLGATPSLTLGEDGSIAVSLGHDLVVSVHFPASIRVRAAQPPRGDATPPEG